MVNRVTWSYNYSLSSIKCDRITIYFFIELVTSSADSCFVLKLRKDFSSEVDLLLPAVWALTAADTSYGLADITQLFRIASHEAKKSRAQSRVFRVVNVIPQWSHLYIACHVACIIISIFC